MHYQPTVDLGTNRIVGAEALIRWRSDTHGLVGPDEFIPLVENTQGIHDLTWFLLNAVVRQISEWDEGSPQWVALNVSRHNLVHADFIDMLTNCLSIWQVDAGRVLLEVTESALTGDSATSLKTLGGLRDKGIRIAIDDFGTGYSSMAYLRETPVHELKIDKSFVQEVEHNKRDREIIKSMVQLAHALGLKIVAEGIESAEVARIVRSLGCDLAQGYYFGKPMEAADFESYIVAVNRAARAQQQSLA